MKEITLSSARNLDPPPNEDPSAGTVSCMRAGAHVVVVRKRLIGVPGGSKAVKEDLCFDPKPKVF